VHSLLSLYCRGSTTVQHCSA